MPVCANGVPSADESNRLPSSVNARWGSTLTSRCEGRVLMNGTFSVSARTSWVSLMVLSMKSMLPPVSARLYSATRAGPLSGSGSLVGAVTLAMMSSTS